MKTSGMWTRGPLGLLVAASLAIGCTEEEPGGGGGAGGAPDMMAAGGAGGGGGGGAGGGGGGGGGQPPPDMQVRDAALPQCSDGIDNDRDGLIDAEDPGCEGPEDDDERDPPECSDGVDNDADGFIDFPEDPGCASMEDDDEFNEPILPQCNDGIDNDRDGLVDEEDPGCASVADPREDDPEIPPQCADGLDNDGDGIIDFPMDPGCTAAGDDDEATPATAPACSNGVDDDGDGLIDYPLDPGCAGTGDRDETDKAVPPQCSDGVDNDRDGKIDYPEDPGCTSAADYDERGTCRDVYDPPVLSDGQRIAIDTRRGQFLTEGSCGGRGSAEVVFFYRVERDLEALEISTVSAATEAYTTLYVRRAACLDPGAEVACQTERVQGRAAGHTLRIEGLARGDYYVFADGVTGRGGLIELQVNEVPLAACRNGLDDDGDGKIDYPSDPGCEDPTDRDETDPLVPPVCSNDEDDDADGFVDYPLDLGCVSAAGDSEVDVCGQGIRFREFFWDQGSVLGNTLAERGATNSAVGSCGGANATEVIYLFNNPFNARLTFSTRHPETETATVVYVRSACADRLSELACDEGDGEVQQGEAVVENAAVGRYYVVVDTRFGQGGPFKLSVDIERLAPGCSDGLDNDGDGLVDGEDPGCEGPEDEDERDPPPGTPPAACNNGVDDDGDGLIDFPFDPGCATRGDDDETSPMDAPQCSNGLDDDDDGIIDFPLEPGCQSAGDDDEADPRPRPACSNRIDDDDDGLTDYPFDPGCLSAGDGSEVDPRVLPACSDGLDNDRDGIIDFPFDPGCISAGHPFEDDPPADQARACSNRVDDDGDGIVDFPRDPGCEYAADPDETSPAFPPQCANGRDDDNNGRIDFPDDPGCRFAAQRLEQTNGPIPPRCSDGVDNDFDGFTDLQDLGCLDAEDDDETDPPGDPPQCGNEIDDDADGQIDWPADPGCQARGDLTEDQSCRPDFETPLIPPNGVVQGQTVEDGRDVYFHRCGGRQAPDAVYRYELAERGDLTISAANPGTDYPVVLAVRTDCEEPRTMVSCAGNFAAPEPTVVLRNAEPGQYYIFVDGGGPEQWVSAGGNIAMPADPRGFVARDDIQDNCGWSDAGNDAFDCYGRFSVTHAGQASSPSIVIGRRNAAAGGYNYIVDSSKPHPNVWRVQFLPAQDFDERPVTLQITGNLGSDGSTREQRGNLALNGREVAWLYTTDAGPNDPPVHHLLVPSDPDQVGSVNYGLNGDNVTITAANIKLPATFYVAVSYAARDAVFQALAEDVEIQAGPGGDGAPRFGNFELSVTESR